MVVHTSEIIECNISPVTFFKERDVAEWIEKVHAEKACILILSGTHGLEWRYELEEDEDDI